MGTRYYGDHLDILRCCLGDASVERKVRENAVGVRRACGPFNLETAIR
jgi:hypothetical protein